MKRRSIGLLALAYFAGVCAVSGASIYEVPEDKAQMLGAWDVNIFADDVHFKTAAILRQVRLRLAIAGEQTCRLWIFDALDRDPLYEQTFTNVAATNPFGVATYDFDLHLQVPKDVYVGFSAQGDGWTNTLSDYWSRGLVVTQGVAGTAGQYYYGTVAGGRLTASYSSGDGSYGCMQILAEPAQIDGVEFAAGQVALAISELPIHASNAVERVEAAGDTNWVEVGLLPPGASNHVWSSAGAGVTGSFYRVKTR